MEAILDLTSEAFDSDVKILLFFHVKNLLFKMGWLLIFNFVF